MPSKHFGMKISFKKILACLGLSLAFSAVVFCNSSWAGNFFEDALQRGRTGDTIYTGPGLSVPTQEGATEIKGISHETSLVRLIIGWTNFMLPYINVLAILALILAGIYYISSFASEDLHTKAKSILIWVIIGIVLVYSSYTIVNSLIKVGGDTRPEQTTPGRLVPSG